MSIKFSCVTLRHMSFCAGVVVAVAFKQVDGSPNAETCTEGDNEGLKNGYCAVEKCHIRFLLIFEMDFEMKKALHNTGEPVGGQRQRDYSTAIISITTTFLGKKKSPDRSYTSLRAKFL